MSHAHATALAVDDDKKRGLLEAGAQIVDEVLGGTRRVKRSATLFSFVTAAEVARRVDKTTGSFFGRWARRDDYVSDLTKHMLEHDRIESLWNRTTGVNAAFDRHASVTDAVYNLTQEYLDVMPGTGFIVQLHMTSVAKVNEDVRSQLQDMYRTVGDHYVEEYVRLIERYGWRLRNGISVEEISQILTALAEGFALQTLAQQDTEAVIDDAPRLGNVSEEAKKNAFGKAVLAMLASFIDADRDQLDIDTYAEERLPRPSSASTPSETDDAIADAVGQD